MILKVRNNKLFKTLVCLIAINLTVFTIDPFYLHASNGGGPSQPEFNAFTPIEANDLVNLFTGDFTYNIPLLDVGGYPLNLSYNGDIKMNQEASWVGLGWNINVGAITRDMRGIPDEFKGDLIEEEFNMKPNRTIGVNAKLDGEAFGFNSDNLSLGFGMVFQWNNYDGVSYSQSVSPSFKMFEAGSPDNTVDLGLSISSDNNGLSLSPTLSYNSKVKKEKKLDFDMSLSVGTSWNTRQGMNSINVQGDYFDQGRKNSESYETATGNVSFDLVNNTYVPQVDFPRNNFSLDANFKIGIDLFGVDGNGSIGGFYAEQKLNTNSLNTPAYGYFFSEDGASNNRVLMDVNLAKNRSFTLNQTNLPIPSFTYDLYNISGHGIGGSFRPVRNDVGYLHERYVASTSGGVSVGFEFAGGNLAHGGADITTNSNFSHSGHWDDFNEATAAIKFKAKQVDSPHEPFYFKMSHEISPDDETEISDPNSLASKVAGFQPIQIALESAGGYDVKAKKAIKPKYSAEQVLTNNSLVRDGNKRMKRNQSISFLNKDEKSRYGVTTSTDGNAEEHHPAEFTVLNSDGKKYVYGEALYNISKKDVSFNVSGRPNTCEKAEVTYTSGIDNSVDNKNGKDHYFSSQTLGPYAHSYLLTAVLSSDYVDLDKDNEPSVKDLGEYVYFKYDSELSNFKWRVPYAANTATFNEGLKTKKDDDRGSYTYGEKVVKYLTKIESKNYIAEFHLSNRQDGYPVLGENGGRNNNGNPLQKLDSISLFSRAEYEQNSTPKPIKKIHFRYNNNLCQGVPSNVNGTGKLTLERVFFTYGFSNKGVLSDYEFGYADTNHDGTMNANPSYAPNAYNVWGGYQSNDNADCTPTSGNPIPSFEYPFVLQNKPSQDEYAASWALTSIKTPEGGKIEIDLEADDYSKVQDKEAMRMFKIKGASDSQSSQTRTNELYSGLQNDHRNYLFFDLPQGISTIQQLKEKCFKNIDNGGELLYFRFLVDQTTANDYEYVEGFSEVDAVGINGGHGWLRLKEICKNDRNDGSNCKKVNPISLATWNFGLANNPQLVNGFGGTINLPGNTPGEAQMKSVLQQLVNPSMINNILEFFFGKYGILLNKKYGKVFDSERSWVRLYNPDDKMLGGGSRVKQIRLYDNWEEMSDPSGSDSYNATVGYAQNYEYTLVDGSTSSGVASYMPIGCRENPHVQPVYFSTKKVLAPSEKHYRLFPSGENFFPSPNIGYSRVSVQKSSTLNNSNPKAETGKAIHEFYTSADFPTLTDETRLQALPKKTGLIGQLLKLDVQSNMFTSQGYSIITNDMNGKEKSIRVYGHNQSDFISGVDYIYETETINQSLQNFPGYSINNTYLKNKYPVINNDGNIVEKTLGVDQDVYTYFSESESFGQTSGMQNNLATFLLGIFPGVVPTFFPSFTQQTTQYKTAITTKHIHKRGILKKIINYDLGASIETENLAWDGETGEVLVTRVINEYGDHHYSLAHPAHWRYDDGMGPAYKNISMELDLSVSPSGLINSTNVNILTPGDEVYFTNSPADKYWVLADGSNPAQKYLVDEDGTVNLNSGEVKIIRSGRRNQHIASIGSIQTKINPIDVNNDGNLNADVGLFLGLSNQKIIQAQAIEYSDKWQMLCGTSTRLAVLKDNCNLTPWGLSVWNYILSSINNSRTLEKQRNVTCAITHGRDTNGNIIQFNQIATILSQPQPHNPTLGDICVFSFMATLINGSNTLIIVESFCPSCPPLMNCTVSAIKRPIVCGDIPGNIINPYFEGIRGNWNPEVSYLYLDSRTQSNYSAFENLDIRRDGVFTDFSPFWSLNSGNWSKDGTGWKWTSKLNKLIPSSKQLESIDALGRHSAVVYGFANNLPIAVANNSTYSQLGYQSFEDYNYYQNLNCPTLHFGFVNYLANVTDEASHTGRNALKINPNETVGECFKLTDQPCADQVDDIPYTLKDCDCAGQFGPETYFTNDIRYVLSYWKKLSNPDNNPAFNYPQISHYLSINSNPVNILSVESGKVIDYWQKVDVVFEIPQGASGDLLISFNNGAVVKGYLDDIRVHPFHSSPKTYAYDPASFRLMAELDENNYATIYEYEKDGKLGRIKKETPRGIMTLQEQRGSLSKE